MTSELDRAMLLIKTLDRNASIGYSEYTSKWYVMASVEIGDGVCLTSPCEHEDSPAAAVLAFLERITDIAVDEYLVTRYNGERREWRFNGAAFSERTREGLSK